VPHKWSSIDRHRINKYYSLLRYFLNESLQNLQNHEWKKDTVEELAKILAEGPLRPGGPTGVIYHVSDMFLEELEKVLQDNPIYTMSYEVLGGLLQPFIKIMSSADNIVATRVSEAVFGKLYQRWSSFFDVDESATKLAAFAQRQNYVLELSKNISQILLDVGAQDVIPSPNRNIIYRTQLPFYSGSNKLTENLKKRKITHDDDPNPVKSQKRKLGNGENGNNDSDEEYIGNSENGTNPENISSMETSENVSNPLESTVSEAEKKETRKKKTREFCRNSANRE